jgi:hypothetical protein
MENGILHDSNNQNGDMLSLVKSFLFKKPFEEMSLPILANMSNSDRRLSM